MADIFIGALALFMVLTPLIFHEMGHVAMLRQYGVPVKQYWLGLGPVLLKLGKLRVGMLPIGGAVVPEPERYQALPPLKRMAVALAGPVFSIAYGIALLLAYQWQVEHAAGDPALLRGWEGVWMLAALNFFLAGLNLLPLPPLDGYHALSAWLEHRKQPLSVRVQRLALRMGNGFVFGIGFFVLGSLFLH